MPVTIGAIFVRILVYLFLTQRLVHGIYENPDPIRDQPSSLPAWTERSVSTDTDYANGTGEISSSTFDKKSPPAGAFLTKKIPSALRQSLAVTFEPDSAKDFIKQCMKKALCSQNEVLHGAGRKTWKFRARHRRGIMRFWHVYECHVYNRPKTCPVDGHWSKWSAWGPCSVSCGHGFRERKRKCDDPAPLNYGKFCSGSMKERETCTKTCTKNFTVLAGEDPLKLQALKTLKETERSFPAISETCSKDHCTYHEVLHIIGDDEVANRYWLSMHCIERYIGCPVDGEWSDWQPWSSCTSECGIGDRFRLRRCNDPPPSNGGAACEGEAFEREDCLGTSCGGQGNASALALFPLWTDWSNWSKCSAKDCRTYGTEYSKRVCVGLTVNALCAVGDGTKKTSLERKRPCVKVGCMPAKKVIPSTTTARTTKMVTTKKPIIIPGGAKTHLPSRSVVHSTTMVAKLKNNHTFDYSASKFKPHALAASNSRPNMKDRMFFNNGPRETQHPVRDPDRWEAVYETHFQQIL